MLKTVVQLGLLFIFLHLFEIEILCNLHFFIDTSVKINASFLNKRINFFPKKMTTILNNNIIKYTWIFCFYFILGIVVYICNISLLLVISHNKITSA